MQLWQLVRSTLRNRTIQAGIWYTAGNILIKILGFLALPLFARLLTPDEFGTVAIFMAVFTMFTIVFSLQLYVVPLRARFDFEDDYQQLISSITSLSIIVSLLFSTVLALLPPDVHESVFELPKNMVLIAALTVPVFLPFRMMLTMWQASSDAKYYIRSSLILNVLSIVASIILIVLPDYTSLTYDGAAGRIAGILLFRILFGLRALIPMLQRGVFYNRRYWRYALLYAVPLVPHALSVEIVSTFDRIMIAQYVGTFESGIYSFAYQIGSVITLTAAAVSAAWLPWFYQHMKAEAFAVITARTTQFMIAFASLTIVAMWMSLIFVPIITPTTYTPAIQIVPIVMASGYFLFLQYLFTGIEAHFKKTWYTSIGTLAAAVINIGLNTYFIPRDGYLAAAWTTLVTYALLFAFHWLIVRVVMRYRGIVNDVVALMAMVVVVLTAFVTFSIS